MKKIDEIKKICLLYYDVYVYRYVFKKFFFLWFLCVVSDKKKLECIVNKVFSI